MFGREDDKVTRCYLEGCNNVNVEEKHGNLFGFPWAEKIKGPRAKDVIAGISVTSPCTNKAVYVPIADYHMPGSLWPVWHSIESRKVVPSLLRSFVDRKT